VTLKGQQDQRPAVRSLQKRKILKENFQMEVFVFESRHIDSHKTCNGFWGNVCQMSQEQLQEALSAPQKCAEHANFVCGIMLDMLMEISSDGFQKLNLLARKMIVCMPTISMHLDCQDESNKLNFCSAISIMPGSHCGSTMLLLKLQE